MLQTLFSEFIGSLSFAMSWHKDCEGFTACIEAASKDDNFNEVLFRLTQKDVDNPDGEEISANKAILSLISPVFYAQFYGPWAAAATDKRSKDPVVEIVDGTAYGFKQMIKFIHNPTSYVLDEQNTTVVQVFEIVYFAHYYGIQSLVSLCRQFLGNWDGMSGKEVLDVWRWANSSKEGLAMGEKFPVEHTLVGHNFWRRIENKFSDVFPNCEVVVNNNELPDEELLIEILGRKCIYNVTEGNLLMVALDFYCKLLEKPRQVLRKGNKKIWITDNCNDEKDWREKLQKIYGVVRCTHVCPTEFSKVINTFSDKIPDKILVHITKMVSSAWKEGVLYERRAYYRDKAKVRFELFSGEVSFAEPHFVKKYTSSVKMKFKINRDAVLCIDRFSSCDTCCSRSDTSECNYCNVSLYDSFTVQNEGELKQRVTDSRLDVVHTTTGPPKVFKFLVKANKDVTLICERKCLTECLFPSYKMDQFYFVSDSLVLDILEVNDQPLTSPCYSFISYLDFFVN